jgi:hypothetical protein
MLRFIYVTLFTSVAFYVIAVGQKLSGACVHLYGDVTITDEGQQN